MTDERLCPAGTWLTAAAEPQLSASHSPNLTAAPEYSTLAHEVPGSANSEPEEEACHDRVIGAVR